MMSNRDCHSLTVKRMKEYVKTHLKEPITLSDIAKDAGYSQYYAERLFKKKTGLTLFEYVRRERLIGAAHALRNGNIRVLDTAYDFVFDSQEGFTRAFTNAFGISPKKFMSLQNPNGWLIPYYFLDRKKWKSEKKQMETKTVVLFTQLIERPARRMILFRSKEAANYDEYRQEVGCGPDGPWTVLSNIREALYEPVGVWLPKSMCPGGTGIYAHAVEVPADYSGEIPDGYDIIDLAPCKYLIFQGEPFDDEKHREAVSDWTKRIRKFNPEICGYRYIDELAPRFQLKPMGWRGYIEGRPVEDVICCEL